MKYVLWYFEKENQIFSKEKRGEKDKETRVKMHFHYCIDCFVPVNPQRHAVENIKRGKWKQARGNDKLVRKRGMEHEDQTCATVFFVPM